MRPIDADELIKEFEWLESQSNDKDRVQDAIQRIKNAPTIEPYGTWIPVSSGKLPDAHRDVWTVLKHTYEDDYKEYSVARYIYTGNDEYHWFDNHYGYLEWDKYSDGRGGCSRYKVVAWMYTEPFREEKKDE